MKSNIFIVEDHPVTQQGYTCLLNQEPDLRVCCVARTPQEAVEKIPASDADVLVIDLTRDGMTEVSLTKQVMALKADLPILIVSVHQDPRCGERALRAGARGYLLKHEADEVIPAIRHLLAGGIYVSELMNSRILLQYVSRTQNGEQAPIDLLSEREMEVFERLGHGYSTREVAEALHISPKTVESHRGRIKTKLGIETNAKLVQRAVQWVEEEAVC